MVIGVSNNADLSKPLRRKTKTNFLEFFSVRKPSQTHRYIVFKLNWILRRKQSSFFADKLWADITKKKKIIVSNFIHDLFNDDRLLATDTRRSVLQYFSYNIKGWTPKRMTAADIYHQSWPTVVQIYTGRGFYQIWLVIFCRHYNEMSGRIGALRNGRSVVLILIPRKRSQEMPHIVHLKG